MQQVFPAALMEKTLNQSKHQAVLIQQFRGTHGLPNRHFIQTLHRLYGAGFVRNNFRQIFNHVVGVLIDRPINQDSVLAVTFPYLHGIAAHNGELDEFMHSNYVRTGASRSIYNHLVHLSGLPAMLISHYTVSPVTPELPLRVVTTRCDTSGLRDGEDFHWVHDQILQHDVDVYDMSFWRRNTVPSAARASVSRPL